MFSGRIYDIRQRQKIPPQITHPRGVQQKKTRSNQRTRIQIWKQSNPIRLRNVHALRNLQPTPIRHRNPIQCKRKLRPMHRIRKRFRTNSILISTRKRQLKINKRKGYFLWCFIYSSIEKSGDYVGTWVWKCSEYWSESDEFEERE